jgi:hypothetical protein
MSTRTVWLSMNKPRDADPDCQYEYEMWETQPTCRATTAYEVFFERDREPVLYMCAEGFERFSAIRLQPGECVKVEFRDPFTRREEGSVTL